MRGWKHHLAQGAFPLSNAILLTLFAIASPYLGIADIAELSAKTGQFFAHYGTPVLFIGAFLEAIYMVNFYFPGSLVIVLAVIASPKTLVALGTITAICWISFMAASLCNYAIGYYGLHRIFNKLGSQPMLDKTAKFLNRYGPVTTFGAAFHPNWLALVMVCYGMSRTSLPKALLLAGASMCVTGPILVGATAFTTLFTKNSNNLFLGLIAIFFIWAVLEIGWSMFRPSQLTTPNS